MAGSASALLGFIQMSLAAGLGMVVGQFHTGTPLVMTAVIAGCGLASLVVYRLLVQRHPAPGFEPLSAQPA